MSKIKVRVALGTTSATFFEECGITPSSIQQNGGDDIQVHEVEFDTEAEKNAYLKGLGDMHGWDEYSIVDDEKFKRFELCKFDQTERYRIALIDRDEINFHDVGYNTVIAMATNCWSSDNLDGLFTGLISSLNDDPNVLEESFIFVIDTKTGVILKS
jgi:hypothetical protein